MIQQDEKDDFWIIAMQESSQSGEVPIDRPTVEDDNDDDDTVDADEGEDSSKCTTYRIPTRIHRDADDEDECHLFTPLRLSPLPSTDGVWSPVGADAWYASALLACLLLYNEDGKDNKSEKSVNSIFRHPFSRLFSTRSNPISTTTTTTTKGGSPIVLELGSGAVGLSGFVLALALEEYLEHHKVNHNIGRTSSSSTQTWKVLLTDNDVDVLRQLERNLKANGSTLHAVQKDDDTASMSSRMVQVQVTFWDWKDDQPTNGLDAEDDVVLVVGSELVYTEETGNACVNLLLNLLSRYPNIEIWILQVSDRYGWWDIVVPTLLTQQNISVDSIPLAPQIHEMASKMIQMGGALDRHAYEAFCIHNL